MTQLLLLLLFAFFAFTSDAFSTKRSFIKYPYKQWSQHLHAATTDSNAHIEGINRMPQVLEFIEPTTNVTVKLVGSMHYNPVSINRAEQIVEDSVQEGRLSAVLIESCPSRWKKTLEMRQMTGPKAELLKLIMRSEMAAASDKAALSAVPTVLADQEIELTRDRMGDALKGTLKDLFSPFSNGWNRLYDDLKEVSELALPSGPQYLGPKDFLDPRLIVSTPVTLLRYPLAFLIRAPITGATVLGGLSLLSLLDPTTSHAVGMLAADTSLIDRISDIGVSAGTSLLEVILLSRMFVVTILHERNIVLAENILDQCRACVASDDTFKSRISEDRVLEVSEQRNNERSPDVVIAVLGMAHCNGVMKLLQEQHVK